MTPTPYDPYAEDEKTSGLGKAIAKFVPDRYSRIRKLVVSVFATGGALVVWLTTDTHTALEIAGAASSFFLTNYGVYEATNE